jgi:hypothetical protein
MNRLKAVIDRCDAIHAHREAVNQMLTELNLPTLPKDDVTEEAAELAKVLARAEKARRTPLTESAIGKAVKAALAAGVSVRRVEVERDKERDKLTIIAGKPDESNGEAVNEWEQDERTATTAVRK